MGLIILLVQLPAVALLLARLLPGIQRPTPLAPAPEIPAYLGQVSVVIPTLNEVQRLSACLAAVQKQGYSVREVLVVDSQSQDGTRELVAAQQPRDPRLRLLSDPPLPSDWVGRPWALDWGWRQSSPRSVWILNLDADTRPQMGLVPALLQLAIQKNYDLITLSPQFILKYPGEWWLQPALLMTLIYRFGATGVSASSPERVMANGQCCLVRRSVLEKMQGYETAKNSFCDDVTLVRNVAKQGYKVGFLDGSRVLQVRMYEGLGETWREWGRSLDLKDATPIAQLWGDAWFLVSVQGAPLLLLVISFFLTPNLVNQGLFWLNLSLVLTRWGMLFAIRPVYSGWNRNSWTFWLSPLADIFAVIRIVLSSVTRPKQWRGRNY
ncbi:putative glycosyl transferase [Gloeomargarita lithophora Alchichica-D10]|uniref:Putative glycosyl transferase n=1 Tax=Gloeomargarita lithophora Alchichica-D10 TaxID=1188229 RepID=A0A1J0AG93_9CYAN|nr:glycosyltransferase family 2 protein [Gloeomargarita lithophora]APB34958.1 putative glycosyl transferase [Gloeomargarita lithophora Alchichica-D10]